MHSLGQHARVPRSAVYGRIMRIGAIPHISHVHCASSLRGWYDGSPLPDLCSLGTTGTLSEDERCVCRKPERR